MAILIIGTLDTKGREIAYLRDRIAALGGQPLVLDSGILGEPLDIVPDITRTEVALAAGSSLDALRAAGTRGAAVAGMRVGVRRVALDLFAAGRLEGIVTLGGAEGAVLGAYAMKALPIGVPKVIVTPIASGKRTFGPLVGTRDILVMHSVIDILGLNPISRAVFDNVAAALVGMAAHGAAPLAGGPDGGRYVAMTMLGNTTAPVMQIKERLATQGWEAVIFHSNGVGGPAMEELAELGMFAGVIDFTTDELSDQTFGGFHQGGTARLERVGALGLPQVVVPGCIDFTVHGPRDEVPDRLRDRPAYFHNPEFTLVRLTADEMAQIGTLMARKLNAASGPLVVVVPTEGLSIPNTPGGVFWDPAADAAFLAALRADLRAAIPLHLIAAHINSPAFADRVADEFLHLLA
ncbi:MAG: Tm-1-like ATP-binding domain-containing protein [Chloroflexota bacterium]|nr:Tm-1-like ATP-binding domain-containing protein [Chloroflexota bacterium]